LSALPLSAFSKILSSIVALAMLLTAVASLQGQNAAPGLTVLARDGRRALPLVASGDQEFVALDDLAAVFQLAVREEAGAITVVSRGRTIVLTPNQTLASVAGRLVSLSAAPARLGGRWSVPLDFINRALALVYDTRLDLRRASRLLVVGDLRVPRITIRYEVVGSAARVTLDTSPGAQSTITQDGNQRLAVKFDADALDLTVPPLQPQAFVQAIRQLDAVTLAIELGPRFGAFRGSSTPIDANTTRLVIDIVGSDNTQTQTTTAAPPPPEPAPAELPQFGGPSTPIRTIAIDAGHGGEDVGARGGQGAQEKEVALAVARRLKEAVEARLGIRVVMTRDDDRAVAMNERTALANNNKADLFISLHANASFRNTVGGAVVYVASFDETTAAAAPLRPERLPVFGGGTRDIELIPWNLAQIAHRERSDRVAAIIAAELEHRVPMAGRPIDHAPLRVLESANMPAVLIEIGYLTNADQEKQLVSAQFQGAFVQTLVDAIVKFRDSLVAADAAGGTR
jgi:N-acetylmuramoyl-L-alanine amidase